MATDFPFGHNFSEQTRSTLAVAAAILGTTPEELVTSAIETVDDRPTKTTYKTYGVVKVLDADGSLTQVETEGGQIFWVKTADLKVTRVRKPKDAPVPTVFVHRDPFVIWLHEHGCTIVGKTPKQWLDKFRAAYSKATGGDLPEADISITEHGKSWSFSLSVLFHSAVPANILPASAKPRRGGLVVCGNAFVLDMLANGFKIGRNEPHVAK